ncbi:hypothetical protein CONPUDRAFT_88867 [Coniophora puteana RWD-64-598 SS2]|uniref:Uncharacterized protein n=1 Tax=Coniophora puteana (strain RWD-64-598) TaxID=741705 RepID=A0A5M3MVR0_CONPW|nr:uncharacterized protein CONPUDRAFT_88867 [Coniophora puteana RWD-64-598 SS2]EIW82805.1 hypothetical protein CONPUDRAFT_88867 [Coniophora puteana RWD-64-598 SS2]
MFNYFAYPPHGAHAAWTNMPMIQHNPYPPAPPPPPPLLHKVWIIDCKTCGTFLTNRGMKAVLLLRPNVSLYSTDALPVNCAAYTTNPEALKPPPCRPLQAPLFPPRTCECLTQTLCCTTCGTPVGYMIVTPCARCTSSITATNRATNGHRFVFHSSEVTPSERHHVPGEPGVIPVDAPLPSSALPPPPPPPPPPVPSSSPPPGMSHGAYRPYGYSSARGESPPPLEPADPARYRLVRVQGVSPPQSPPPLSSTTATNGNAATGSGAMRRGSLQSSGSGSGSGSGSDSGHPTAQQPEQPRGVPGEQRDAPLVKLRAGDVLYWHHLVKTGEIPGVHEDKRARRPAPVVGAGAARRAPMHFDR